MTKKIMILPAHEYTSIRLVRIPDDFDEQEVFRYVTGLIAQVEESDPEYSWEQVATMLEDHGFEILDFILGPALD